MRISRKKKENMINKAIIGLGFGLVKTRDKILKVRPQEAMDALSVWIGREIMKELFEKKVVKVEDNEQKLVEALTNVINLAETLDIEYNKDQRRIKIVVQNCDICPKRIGGYNLEGESSCPVGGIISGALAYARGASPKITKNDLKTGEICQITLEC